MDWHPYKDCCVRAAGTVDSDVGYCPDCGHVLMRCVAFTECRSLVTPTQPCPSCVAPILMIDAGAVVTAKAGERMSVPLILLNSSPAGRTLWLKRVAKRDGTAEEQITLPWEQLDARTERRISLDTPPMADGGTYTLNVILVLATRYKSLEEEYAFAAAVSVKVATSDAGPQNVSVTVSGASAGTAAGHNVIANIRADRAAEMAAAALENRRILPLERAERYELEQGIRGYRRSGLRVLRHVEFAFSGFRPDETPPAGAALVSRGRMLFGRNSRAPDPSANATPNDVCLRAYDARSKQVDEPATMAISRHHFELVVVNDRLCVHARATSGMQVNAEDLTPGQVFAVVPADRIIPIPGRGDKLTLRVGFTNAVRVVERIDVSRTPALT
ncbi:MAG: hypothetical protein ABI868_17255 [Acidobacteriota bacterium]